MKNLVKLVVFNQPIWKNMNVHLDHVPQVRDGTFKKIFETTT